MKASMITIGSLTQASRSLRITLLIASFTLLRRLLNAANDGPSADSGERTSAGTCGATASRVGASRSACRGDTPSVLPLEDALLAAANNLFSTASAALAAPPAQRVVVIDPLVDGVSHTQTVTTQSLETKIQGLVKAKYPGFNAQPFSRATVGQAPIVLVGTFTASI